MGNKEPVLLKNGNPQGDPNAAPRCGAKSRAGTPCRAPAMKNGRCRFHGGKSTGPKTPEGLEKSRKANRKHGLYSMEVLEEQKNLRALLKLIEGLSKRGDIEPRVVDGFIAFLLSRQGSEIEPKLGKIDFEKLNTDQRLKLYNKSVNRLGRQLRSSAKLIGKIERQKKGSQ